MATKTLRRAPVSHLVVDDYCRILARILIRLKGGTTGPRASKERAA